MSEQRGMKALQAAADALTEYFDTVQIFVSKNKNEDITIGQSLGKGSLFARIGQVELWLSKVHNALTDDEDADDENTGKAD